MKVKKYDKSDLRLILAGCVTDPGVLAHVSPHYNKETGLFGDRWADLVLGWCISYFDKYNKPPGTLIEDRFERWAEGQRDDETVELVDRFLQYLAKDYDLRPEEDKNTDYIVDRAAVYFEKTALLRLKDKVAELAEQDDLPGAKKLITDFAPPNIGGSSYIGLEDEHLQDAFEHEEEVLIKYPGSLGEFFGAELCRDAFVSFMAPEKRGKSWWLIDMGLRGLRSGFNVAFFAVGDMTKRQMIRRFGIYLARHPRRAKTIKYPTSIYPNEEGGPVDVIQEEKIFNEGIKWQHAAKAVDKCIDKKRFRLSISPADTMSAMGIRSTLMDWARTGWVPDVVVVDYADILASDLGGQADDRSSINKTWKTLRRISQEFHCLVATATQADADSYDQELLSRKNFSEDKRKHAHVTAMIGLNQNNEEKPLGVMRVNLLDLREDFFVESSVVHVAGCLDVGRPVVLSSFS